MKQPKPSPFILASASPRRKDLLATIGVIPSAVRPAEIDETPHRGELPRLYVQRMAQEKAIAISQQQTDTVVLAADTVVACGRRILPKAQTQRQATECLTLLSGRRHTVYTAFALYRGQQNLTLKYVSTMVRFKQLTPAEMNWYLSTGEWQGKAGGYAIQGAAQALIQRIQGSYSAVVGLPLCEVWGALNHARII